VSERLRRARGGVRGGVQGAGPRAGVRGQRPRKFFFWADIFSPVSGRHIIAGPTYFRDHMILGGFRHMVFADGFSISG
jgi:hypothetical protein